MTVPLTPRRLAALAAFACLAFSHFCHAETITLFPVADATLIEVSPSNSLGSAGWITAGTTQNGTSNRALIKFDFAAAVPTGSTIIDVGLYVWVTRRPVDGISNSTFSLRRMLRDWGEGSNPGPASSPGLGLPAQPGDATWFHCFWSTNTWTVPGGQEGVDYSADISTTTQIEGVSPADRPYFFEAGGAVADVQFWVDHPEFNFGWMLKSEDELSPFTARRFGSRELEDPTASPQLFISYVPPPRITSINTTNNRIALTFSAESGYYYRIEKNGDLCSTNSWAVLTNYGFILIPGSYVATDTNNSAQRFYRVRRD